MTINDFVVKLSGSASIDRPLDLDKEYRFSATGAVTDINHSSNEDGTFDQIHKLKVLYLTIESDGELIPAKDKSRQSQKLRRAILNSRPPDSPLDEEAYYQSIMGGIRHYLDEILDLIQKRDAAN